MQMVAGVAWMLVILPLGFPWVRYHICSVSPVLSTHPMQTKTLCFCSHLLALYRTGKMNSCLLPSPPCLKSVVFDGAFSKTRLSCAQQDQALRPAAPPCAPSVLEDSAGLNLHAAQHSWIQTASFPKCYKGMVPAWSYQSRNDEPGDGVLKQAIVTWALQCIQE